jgi:methionyl-tRNA formyltransferase
MEFNMTRVVFMGTPDFAVPALAALLSEGYDVVGVLTRPDRPAGRGQRVEESPVKRLARANGLPILQPSTLRDAEARAAVLELQPDVITVAAYGLLLPQALLDLPGHGCLNIHGSLLPRHRGAAPIAAAILAGEAATGVSIMRVDAGLDTGPVLASASLPIDPEDTTGSLTAKLAALGARLLIATLPRWLRGELVPTPQDDAQATLAPRIAKEAGQIDWNQPAVAIERQVRAYSPWPSAYTYWRGQLLKVHRSHADFVVEVPAGAGPGQVIPVLDGAAAVAGSGVLRLDEVQLAGKRVLPISTFLRGASGFIGSSLK